MRRGNPHVLRRAGNRAERQFHPRPRLAHVGVVAVRAPRVAPVGIAAPEVMGHVRVAVHVVPTRISQHAAVVHAGLPLVGVVPAQLDDVAAVRHHPVQGEGRQRTGTATALAAGAGRDEHDPAAGEETGIEIVKWPVAELGQAAAINAGLENVVAAFRAEDIVCGGRHAAGGAGVQGGPIVGVANAGRHLPAGLAEGEQNSAAVVVQIQGHEPATVIEHLALEAPVLDPATAQHTAHRRPLGKRPVERVHAAAPLGIAAQVLIDHVHVAANLLVVRRKMIELKSSSGFLKATRRRIAANLANSARWRASPSDRAAATSVPNDFNSAASALRSGTPGIPRKCSSSACVRRKITSQGPESAASINASRRNASRSSRALFQLGRCWIWRFSSANSSGAAAGSDARAKAAAVAVPSSAASIPAIAPIVRFVIVRPSLPVTALSLSIIPYAFSVKELRSVIVGGIRSTTALLCQPREAFPWASSRDAQWAAQQIIGASAFHRGTAGLSCPTASTAFAGDQSS